MTNPQSEPLTAQSISGFRALEDPMSCEKKLGAAVIFLAWKDACEGDKGAFKFAFDSESGFSFWCMICGLDVLAVRACFERLRIRDKSARDNDRPLNEVNPEYPRCYRPSAISVDEVQRAIRLFIKMRSEGTSRKEILTWIALDMEKRFESVENLFYMLARKAKGKQGNIYLTGFRKEFKEAWDNG